LPWKGTIVLVQSERRGKEMRDSREKLAGLRLDVTVLTHNHIFNSHSYENCVDYYTQERDFHKVSLPCFPAYAFLIG
jgi:hypothetical protein